MSEVRTWDETAANNNSAAPDGWPEGMPFAGVNNSAREMMAAVARWMETYEGVTSTGSGGTYVLTLAGAVPSLATGDRFTFQANHSSAASGNTLNVNGTGAVALILTDGTPTSTDTLVLNGMYEVVYDGTSYQILAGISSAAITGQIQTNQIADGAVTEPKVATDAVSTIKVQDDAITEAKIAPGAVTGTEIAIDSVNDTHLDLDPDVLSFLQQTTETGMRAELGAMTETNIGAGAVTRAKLGPRTVNAQTGATYTLVLADRNAVVTMDNGSANTLTIPLNATAAFATGSQVDIIRLGAGVTTVDALAGVTLNGVNGGQTTILTRYAPATLIKVATDTWVLFGDVGIVA